MQYNTTNLQLASYLACRGDIKFLGVKKQDQDLIVFIFEPSELASQAAVDYYSDNCEVSASKLMQKYQTLKDLLFEAKRGNAGYRA